jgi:hypothetical protein
VGGDSGEVYAAVAVFDNEEDFQASGSSMRPCAAADTSRVRNVHTLAGTYWLWSVRVFVGRGEDGG